MILFLGTSGAVLGAAIPIAQAIRKKNDPIAWMWGGFAAGSVFGLKSKFRIQYAKTYDVSMVFITLEESHFRVFHSEISLLQCDNRALLQPLDVDQSSKTSL